MQNGEQKTFSPELVPWQIWVTIGVLGYEGILNFFMIFHNPVALTWLAAKILFITGLLKKWKWVYVANLIFGAIHVVFFAISGALVVSLINLILMILLISAHRYYFPKKEFEDITGRPVI